MAAGQSTRVSDNEPRTGAAILFDGREWQVAEQASYSTAEGYRVTEWRCECGGTTGYLLKEGDAGTVRWFFTRGIPTDSVKVSGGEGLAERLKKTAEAPPPETLEHEGESYRFEDTTDGTYEDESGASVRKVTWDYWDSGRRRNLAVERWPDGSCDTYLGGYIDPGQFTLRPAAPAEARPKGRGSPLLVMAVSVLPGYLIGFVMGWPFDEAFSFALCVALALGWAMIVGRVPLAALAGLILGAVAAQAFLEYPPFTTWTGLLTLLGAPTLVGLVGRSRGYGSDRRAVQYAGAIAVAAPLLGVGVYFYFSLAPGPHTPEQLWLAVGAAGPGALAGFLLAGLPLRREAP